MGDTQLLDWKRTINALRWLIVDTDVIGFVYFLLGQLIIRALETADSAHREIKSQEQYGSTLTWFPSQAQRSIRTRAAQYY